MIWRDDDIAAITRGARLEQLCRVDDCFQDVGVLHTIAVIAEGIDRNPDLIAAIKARGMRVQLHAWSHKDLSDDAESRAQLPRAVELLTAIFGDRPTVLYPPWNRTSPELEAAAAALGLTVSTKKVSLEQYLRFRGNVAEDVVNFHYWDTHEHELLPTALTLYRDWSKSMKPTDYCPRAAPFDVHLRNLRRRYLVGVEVGVDAGAHAEALLRHCDIEMLHLVDRWPKDYHLGYCEGRLSALGFRPRFTLVQRSSEEAAKLFQPGSLDFVYCDEGRDFETVRGNLARWWPLLKSRGLLGYRGYANGYPVAEALDQFVKAHPEIRYHVEPGEELILVKP